MDACIGDRECPFSSAAPVGGALRAFINVSLIQLMMEKKSMWPLSALKEAMYRDITVYILKEAGKGYRDETAKE